jgi:alkanesulfonate monooxygenase SsuD/methylene tetrahydromethanopterin reductase-like flavin-dependent oxidoreductase (luciferase family)
MAANSHETFPIVGKMGLPIFIGLRAAEIPDLQEHLSAYRGAWREAGHPGDPSVYLRIPVYVSTTEEGAREEPRASLTYFFERQSRLARSSVGRAGTGPADRRQAQADRMANLTYDDILARKVAFGTAEGVIARLEQLRAELGIDGIVTELNPGGLIPLELERRSLQLLTRDVIPAFK